jgi:hypothetical protein
VAHLTAVGLHLRRNKIFKNFLMFMEVRGRVTGGLRPAPAAKFIKVPPPSSMNKEKQNF